MFVRRRTPLFDFNVENVVLGGISPSITRLSLHSPIFVIGCFQPDHSKLVFTDFLDFCLLYRKKTRGGVFERPQAAVERSRVSLNRRASRTPAAGQTTDRHRLCSSPLWLFLRDDGRRTHSTHDAAQAVPNRFQKAVRVAAITPAVGASVDDTGLRRRFAFMSMRQLTDIDDFVCICVLVWVSSADITVLPAVFSHFEARLFNTPAPASAVRSTISG